METFKTIYERASVRNFLEKEVPREMIEKMIDAGRMAPSARAIQPWEFVAVTHRETLRELGRLAENGRFLQEAACCVAVFCRGTKYYLEDGCAATQNILLAAADLGLGACWVAGDKKDYALAVAGLLKAPDNVKLVSMIAIGWPAENTGSFVRRRKLEEVLYWETF